MVTIDPGDLRKAKALLSGIKGGVPRVIARALNKTLTGVRKDAVKEIQKTITPKAKVIRKTFKISKATVFRPTGVILSTGKPLGLIHFKARQTKKGVTLQIKKKEPRKFLKHAFIATMPSGHKGVFWREYKGTRGATRKGMAYAAIPRKYRLPIKELYGPRVPDILSNEPVMKPILDKAKRRLRKNFSHELNFLFSRLG